MKVDPVLVPSVGRYSGPERASSLCYYIIQKMKRKVYLENAVWLCKILSSIVLWWVVVRGMCDQRGLG